MFGSDGGRKGRSCVGSGDNADMRVVMVMMV